jgi:hypothetical protein
MDTCSTLTHKVLSCCKVGLTIHRRAVVVQRHKRQAAHQINQLQRGCASACPSAMAQNGSADVPGMPPGGIDLSALHNVLSDPGIKVHTQPGVCLAGCTRRHVLVRAAACVIADSTRCLVWCRTWRRRSHRTQPLRR